MLALSYLSNSLTDFLLLYLLAINCVLNRKFAQFNCVIPKSLYCAVEVQAATSDADDAERAQKDGNNKNKNDDDDDVKEPTKNGGDLAVENRVTEENVSPDPGQDEASSDEREQSKCSPDPDPDPDPAGSEHFGSDAQSDGKTANAEPDADVKQTEEDHVQIQNEPATENAAIDVKTKDAVPRKDKDTKRKQRKKKKAAVAAAARAEGKTDENDGKSRRDAAGKDKKKTRERSRSKSQPPSPTRRSGDTQRNNSAPRSTFDTEKEKDQSVTPTRKQRKDKRTRKPAESQSKDNGQTKDSQKSSQNEKKEAVQPSQQRSSTIPEQVRIFEMRLLTSREMEKARRYRQQKRPTSDTRMRGWRELENARRYRLQLGHSGGTLSTSTSDKQLARLLTDNYNDRAHRGYHIDSDQVNDLETLHTQLKGKPKACFPLAECRLLDPFKIFRDSSLYRPVVRNLVFS